MAETVLNRDAQDDLKFLESLYKETGGGESYETIESNIFDAYGGEDKFLEKVKTYNTDSNLSTNENQESSVDATVNTTAGEISAGGDALGSEVNTLINQQDIIKNLEDDLNNRDQLQSEIDFISETVGLSDGQKIAMEKSFGLNNQNLFERITNNIGAVFKGRDQFGIDPMSGEYAFAKTSPADELKERLANPMVGIGLNLIEEGGTPSFKSPFARVASAVNDYTKDARDADLAKLKILSKQTSTTDKGKFSFVKGLKYTIGDVMENGKDKYFPDKTIGTTGIVSGVTHSQDGIIDLQTFVEDSVDPVDPVVDPNKLDTEDVYKITESKSDKVISQYESQIEPGFLEAQELMPLIDSQISAIRVDNNAFQEYGPRIKTFAPLAQFLKAILPNENLYNTYFKDFIGIDYQGLSQLKFEDKVVTKKVLTQSKKIYPVSNADIELLANSFANYGDSPEIYLRTASFQHGLGEYSQLVNTGYMQFLSANKDPDSEDFKQLGTTNLAVAGSPDGGLELNGKKYNNAISYARAYAMNEIKKKYGDINPGEYGYKKNRLSDYSSTEEFGNQSDGLEQGDYSPIAYLASAYYEENSDILSATNIGSGNAGLIFVDEKPLELFGEVDENNTFELDREKTDSKIITLLIQMYAEVNKLNALGNMEQPEKEKAFNEMFPAFVFPTEDNSLEEQYISMFENYGNK
jgi:hypothetical protein